MHYVLNDPLKMWIVYLIFLLSYFDVGLSLTVGIVGAGVSGLYSGIMLQSLGIDYQIYEATHRPGGRVFTYRFDTPSGKPSEADETKKYNYFDVGAMRIPKTPIMERLCGDQSSSLINYINNHPNATKKVQIIPYTFRDQNTTLYFNNVLRHRTDNLSGDPFKTGYAFAKDNPDDVWKEVIGMYLSKLSQNVDEGIADLDDFRESMRDYLKNSKHFSSEEIDWLETFEDATGNYMLDVVEIVLEDWFFGFGQNLKWITVDGGMSRLVEGMEGVLTKPVKYGAPVKKITQSLGGGLLVEAPNQPATLYDHVINTASLGAMQQIDMSSLNLGYDRQQAIREVHYDDAMKIGMKFKSRWWEKLDKPIRGGESVSDLPIRKTVYPSWATDDPDAPAVLIASYTWGQDARRLSGYLRNSTSQADLVNLVLKDLALLHNVTFKDLNDSYIDHFAYAWSDDEYALGAWSSFAPGQLQDLVPLLAGPAGADGRLHFGGSALSVAHSWMVGGLETAYKCVYQVLNQSSTPDVVDKFEKMWFFEYDPSIPKFTSSSRNIIAAPANLTSSSSTPRQSLLPGPSNVETS